MGSSRYEDIPLSEAVPFGSRDWIRAYEDGEWLVADTSTQTQWSISLDPWHVTVDEAGIAWTWCSG